MSHSIFYRAMFIKMNDGTYIPMIECGDSNVWEAVGRRRARSWSECRWITETDEQRKRYSLSETEILAGAQNDPNHCIEISGRGTNTGNELLNFLRSGIRNAITMDDLSSGIRLDWYDENNNYKYENAANETELSEKWARCLDMGIVPSLRLLDGCADAAWRSMKARNRKERVQHEHTEFFLVSFDFRGASGYLQRLTGRHLWHTESPNWAHKYSTRSGAEHAAKRIFGRFSGVTNIKVVNA